MTGVPAITPAVAVSSTVARIAASSAIAAARTVSGTTCVATSARAIAGVARVSVPAASTIPSTACVTVSGSAGIAVAIVAGISAAVAFAPTVSIACVAVSSVAIAVSVVALLGDRSPVIEGQTEAVAKVQLDLDGTDEGNTGCRNQERMPSWNHLNSSLLHPDRSCESRRLMIELWVCNELRCCRIRQLEAQGRVRHISDIRRITTAEPGNLFPNIDVESERWQNGNMGNPSDR